MAGRGGRSLASVRSGGPIAETGLTGDEFYKKNPESSIGRKFIRIYAGQGVTCPRPAYWSGQSAKGELLVAAAGDLVGLAAEMHTVAVVT